VSAGGLTREGLVAAAEVLERLARERRPLPTDKEADEIAALTAAAEMLRDRATWPDEPEPDVTTSSRGGGEVENPRVRAFFVRWFGFDPGEAAPALPARPLAGAVEALARSLDEHTRATRRLTDAVQRSTSLR